MNLKERLLRTLRREAVDRPPAAVPTQCAIVDVMKASGFAWPKAQQQAADMAGLAWACHEIGGIESVRVPFDITVEAEAMGCPTRFGEDMATPPISKPFSRADYGGVRIPDPRKDGRMPEVVEAVRMLRERAGDEVPVIAALGTPFEVLSTTMSFEDITMLLVEDPDFLAERLGALTEFAIRYGRTLEEAGPDVLMLVDGTSQSLGPKYYNEVSLPYTRQLVAALGTPTILHVCGKATRLLEGMVQTGASALSIDKPVDLDAALKATAGRAVLVGNISPQTLSQGPIGEILKETDEAIGKGVHVVAPGCGILPWTPLQNLKAYIQRVKESGRK
jgi:[methyl-Co(III) methanol-specific corrinoid protein]:coenzyme M methyltransferase